MNVIKNIVVPIDFSKNMHAIVGQAVYVAGTFQARVQLVHVVQGFEDYSGFFVPPVDLPNLEEEIFQAAEQHMDHFISEVKSLPGSDQLTATEGIVLTGDVAERLLSFIEESDSDLVVMGTHGYKGFERLMFGSIAEKIVKHACCPVMTVNPDKMKDG